MKYQMQAQGAKQPQRINQSNRFSDNCCWLAMQGAKNLQDSFQKTAPQQKYLKSCNFHTLFLVNFRGKY